MDNVINLFSRKATVPAQAQTDAKQASEAPATEVKVIEETAKQDFGSIAQKNALVQEKLRKERAEANKSVLKSYRIK